MTNERLRRTPLYEVAVAAGGRMVSFGGWEMPVQFEGIRSEHWAVRRAVGLFDISHMGRISISGGRGLAFLDSLLPARIRELTIGQMLYAPLCNEQGGCVDDLVVYRLAQQEYLLVVNASRKTVDWQWITERAAGWSDVQIEDLSDERGMVAVQGPRATALIEALAGPDSAALGYYRCAEIEIAGIRALLSRNGYTGEDGFEIMCPADQVAALWSKLRAAGAQPCGLGARDTLRLEMGFCLYGSELNEQTTPLEAGLAWTLDLKKEANFVGAEALRAQRTAGGYRRLRGFRMLERGIPRSDYSVFDQRGEQVGIVTSGTHSPVLGEGIGLAYLQRGAQKIGTQVYIDMKGRQQPAVVVKLPFVPSAPKKD